MTPTALKFWDEPALDWSAAGGPPMPKDEISSSGCTQLAMRRSKVVISSKKGGKEIMVDWSQDGLKEAQKWMLRQPRSKVLVKPMGLPRGPMPTVVKHMPVVKHRGSDRRGAKNTVRRINQPGGSVACNRVA